MDDDRLLNAEEAARFFGLKLATIRRLTAAQEIPHVRITGRRAVRYRLKDLQELVRMRTQPMHGGSRR